MNINRSPRPAALSRASIPDLSASLPARAPGRAGPLEAFSRGQSVSLSLSLSPSFSPNAPLDFSRPQSPTLQALRVAQEAAGNNAQVKALMEGLSSMLYEALTGRAAGKKAGKDLEVLKKAARLAHKLEALGQEDLAGVIRDALQQLGSADEPA